MKPFKFNAPSFLDRVFWIMLHIIFAFGLFISTIIPQSFSIRRNPQVCKSKECMTINKDWLSKVDFTADPCQDFYKFACGKYNNSVSELILEEKRIHKQLIDIVKIQPSKNDHRAMKMVKEMYQYCLNHESNINDVKKIISSLGGWSALNSNWNGNNFSLAKFYSKLMEFGYIPKSLFIIDMNINPTNKQNVISIKPLEDISIQMERVFENSWPLDLAATTEDVAKYVHHILIPMLSQEFKGDPMKMKEELFKYMDLRDVVTALNKQPSNFQNLKLKVVKFFYGNIPWNELLSVVFAPIPITDNDDIIIQCPRCLNGINKLIANMSKESLATFVMSSFVFDVILDANSDLLNNYLKYIKTDTTKEEYCITKLFKPFRRIVDSEYINRGYFDKGIIPMVKNYIEKIKVTMQNLIQENSLLDPETRNRSIDKLNAIVFKIAYDDEIEKGQALQYYDNLNLNINSKSYFTSFFKIMKFTRKKYFGTLKKPAKLPYLKATYGNAEYHAFFNTIFFSISVLKGAIYSKSKRTEYFNFGNLGFTIAHEMNHGFDVAHLLQDKHGNIVKRVNHKTMEELWKKFECISHQYSTFTNVETGNKVNGHQTLTENIADIGGMEVTYKTYHNLPKDGELLLQNFQYTLPQMFWIAYGTSKCSKPSKETVLQHERISFHAEPRIRVNGVAMNTEEFAAD